jgi:hypothetical protein
VSALTQRPSWRALDRNHEGAKDFHLPELFTADPRHGERFVAEGPGVLDYTKNRRTEQEVRSEALPRRSCLAADARYALSAGASAAGESGVIDTIFTVSSVLTPFALGAAIGAIATDQVPLGNARRRSRPRNCDDLASATHPAPFNAGGAPRLQPAPAYERHDGKVLDGPDTGTQREAGAVSSAPCAVYGAFDPVAGVATRAAAHRLGRRGSHHRAGCG